jgi:hypothetical protein
MTLIINNYCLTQTQIGMVACLSCNANGNGAKANEANTACECPPGWSLLYLDPLYIISFIMIYFIGTWQDENANQFALVCKSCPKGS